MDGGDNALTFDLCVPTPAITAEHLWADVVKQTVDILWVQPPRLMFGVSHADFVTVYAELYVEPWWGPPGGLSPDLVADLRTTAEPWVGMALDAAWLLWCCRGFPLSFGYTAAAALPTEKACAVANA